MSSSSSLICSDQPQREVTFFDIFQLFHANELPNKLSEFSSFKFLWGFIQNSLLPLLHMKLGRKTHLAAASFMKYLFHTDARLWALLCCQTLIPALPATLQLGHIQRGYVYMSVCTFENICCELYSWCACVCWLLVPLYRMQRDGSRLLHVLPKQHLAMRAVQVCHLDAGRSRVCPVQFVMDPIYGQPT